VWFNTKHGAYAASRLLDAEWHQPVDALVAASYRV